MDGFWVLFCFLPLFMAVYLVTPDKEKVLTLLVGSVLFFWAIAERSGWRFWAAILLIPACYWSGRLGRTTIGLLVSLAVWGLCALMGTVPVWMRFLLMQLTGTLLEVRREQFELGSGVEHTASVLMFPKLLYGPYVPLGELMDQMRKPRLSWGRAREGLQELVMGFAGTVLLGGWLQDVLPMVPAGATFPGSWVRVVLCAVVLTFRFWGCTTMAVGAGKLLGYELPQSVRQPWLADSVTGYFSRWNVSLWRWLDQVLGISQKEAWRKSIVLFVAGVAMGAWYGPQKQTLLWGVFVGVVMAAEQGSFGVWLKDHGLFARCYMLVTVLVGWGIFFVDDPGRLLRSGGGVMGPGVWCAVLVGAFFCSSMPMRIMERCRDKLWFDVVLVIMFWACIWFLV